MHDLDATFAALADPTRRAVVSRLAKGQATVNELAKPFDMTLPAFSKHLKVLERAGLIEKGREAQFRPCRLKPEALTEATDWLEQHRKVWEGRLDRLEAFVKQVQQNAAPNAGPDAGPNTVKEISDDKDSSDGK
jgi:DNA-binding transcriptional ArsR family regulator